MESSGDFTEKYSNHIEPRAVFRGKYEFEPIRSRKQELFGFFRDMRGMVVQNNPDFPIIRIIPNQAVENPNRFDVLHESIPDNETGHQVTSWLVY